MAKQQTIRVDLEFNVNTERAKRQMGELQSKLNSIMSMTSRNFKTDAFAKEVERATVAATKLQANLAKSFNVDTGKLNLTKFNYELQKSGMTLQQYKAALVATGPEGAQAFKQLANAITTAEAPLLSLTGGFKKLGTTLANTIRWQVSASVIQGFTSALSKAYNFAQDLNKSLNDIRIVTGYSADFMEDFANKANKAAKALKTTTNEYSKASLIYFQQGLSLKEVEERTNATIKLAQVTGDSVEEVSNQLTSIWNNFDNGTKSLEYYADVITALGAATASSTDEISQGLEKFAAIAETVGLSYEYATAALATVTSETRQSADIVGTAFKTLFARIQDLELGKTLDDGVTLGQYSAALEAIGVKVLNANGSVKEMNEILNQMGERWGKISKAQQISVAQSVAGVRQYTQLIALMDNWDKFQANVNIAIDSEGTLTEQQEIWAEGWEAASNKVKASLETIYQQLLDDDAFIDILNFVSDLTDSVGGLVRGLGGLKGILPLISALLLKTFSSEISEGINSMAFTLRSATKSGRVENEALKASMIQEMKQDAPKTGVGAFTGEATINSALMQEEYNKQVVKLTKIQKLEAEMYLNRNLALTEAVDLTAKEVREAQKLYNARKSVYDLSTQKLLDQYKQAKTAEAIQLNIGTASSEHMEIDLGESSSIEQKISAVEEISMRLKTIGVEADNLSPKLANMLGGQSSPYATGMKEYAAAVNQASAAVKEYQRNSNADNANKMIKAIENMKISYQNLNSATTGTTQSIREQLKAVITDETELKKLLQITNMFAESQGDLVRLTGDSTNAMEKFAKGLQEVIKRKQSGTQAVVELAGSLSSLAFAINSLKSINDVLNNSELTWGEKFLSIVTSLGFAIPMLIKGLQGLKLENIKVVATNLANILSFGQLKKALKKYNEEVKKKIELEETDKTNGSGDSSPKGVTDTEKQTNAVREQKQEIKEKMALEEADKANGSGDSGVPKVSGLGYQDGEKFKYTIKKGEKRKTLEGITKFDKDGNAHYYTNNKRNREVPLDQIKKKKIPSAPQPSDIPVKGTDGVPPVGVKEAVVGTKGAAAGVAGAVAVAAIVAVITAAIVSTIISVKKGFEQVEKEAKQAEENAKNLKQAFTDAKSKFDELMSTSSSNKKAVKSLKEMQKSTVEYTQALNNANAQALELIENYKDLEYHWEDGVIVFENMDEVLEAENERVSQALGRSELARSSAIEKRSRATITSFARHKLGDTWAGYDSNFLGIGLGDPETSKTEEVLQKLADMYNEQGEVIFENFAMTIRDTELGIEDYGIISALQDNEKAVKELTREIAKEDNRSKEAWKNAYIQENQLGNNPNANAIAEQAWQFINDSEEGKAKKKETEQEVANLAREAFIKDYMVNVLGENEEDIKRNGSGIGSGYIGKNYLLEDLGGVGITVKYRPDEKSDWTDLYGENNFAYDTAREQLVNRKMAEYAADSGNVSNYNENANEVRGIFTQAGFKKDDSAVNRAINSYFSTGTIDLTDFSGEDIAKFNLEEIQDDSLRAALEEAIAGYWDAIRAANKNSNEKYAEEIGTTEANELLAILQKAELSQQDFENYIKQFSKYGTAAEEIAKNLINVKNRQQDLNKVFSEGAGEIYKGIVALNNGKEVSADFTKVVTKVQTGLTKWFGVDLGYDFVVANLEEIQKAIEGDEEALKKLRHEASKKIVAEMNVEHQGAKDFLNSFIETSSAVEHFEGEILNSYDVLSGFNTLLQTGQVEASQLRALLSNEGWQLDIEVDKDGKEFVKQIVYVGQGLEDLSDNLEKTAERYHYLKETLEDLDNYYNRVSKAKDRAFGADKLALMDKEAQALKDLKDKQKDYIDAIESDLSLDYSKIADYGAQLDEYGRVKNADELLERFKDDKNFKALLDQYEKTLNLLEEQEDKYRDLINKELDAKLEKIKYELELEISLSDDSLKTLEYQIDKLGEGFEKVAEAISLYSQKMGEYGEQMTATQDTFEKFLNEKKFTEEAKEKIRTGADLDAKDFIDTEGNQIILTENEITQMRQWKDDLISYEQSAREAFKGISESIISGAEDFNNQLNKNTDSIKRYGEVANGVLDIVDLLGGTLQGSDELIQTLNDQKVTSAKASAEAAKISVAENRQALDSAREARKNAADKYGEDSDIVKEWDKTIETLTENVEKAEDDWMSTISEGLQTLADAFETNMNQIFKTFENTMAGAAGTFENLQAQFDRQSEKNERYLQDYEKAYQLSKLNRDITNSIDETDNVKAKQKLRELQEEMNALQAENKDVSQYELDNLQAKYDLRLAEIALEEAQNAKSQVRMSRDSEGNWSYVYTADQDKVDEAQQNYEDKLYNIQNLQQEYIQETQSQLVQLESERTAALQEIMNDTTLTAEQKKEKMQEVNNFYDEKSRYLYDQLGIVLSDAKELYETDMTNYAATTGNKIMATEDWIDEFKETPYALATEFESIEQAEANTVNKSTELLGELEAAAETYETNVKDLMDKAGASIEGVGNKADAAGKKMPTFAESIEDMAEDAKTAIGDEKSGLLGKMNELAAKDPFTKIVSNAEEAYNNYNTAIKPYLDKNSELIGSIDEVIAKYSALKTAQSDADQSTREVKYTPPGGSPEGDTPVVKTGVGYGDDLSDKSLTNRSNFNYTEILGSKQYGNAWLTTYKDESGQQQQVWTETDATKWLESGSAQYQSLDNSEYDKEKAEKAEKERQEKIKNGSYVEKTFYGSDGSPVYYKMSRIPNKLIPANALNKEGIYLGQLSTSPYYATYDTQKLLAEAPEKLSIEKFKKDGIISYYRPDDSYSIVDSWATYWELTPTMEGSVIKVPNEVENNRVKGRQAQEGSHGIVDAWLNLDDLYLQKFDTGGYTGEWDSSGRLAMLHQKEIVLNASDTENFLSAIGIVRDIAKMIDLQAASQQYALMSALTMSTAPSGQTLQQEVTIHAEFPNATDRNEIEEAFKSLVNRASQFANRKN